MLKIAALVLMFAAPVAAQTVEARLDLDTLGWGRIDTPRAVNTDGSELTVEWLIRSSVTGMYRVVATNGASLCAGEWFSATAGVATVSVQHVGNVDKLVVAPVFGGPIMVVGLDTPRCQ